MIQLDLLGFALAVITAIVGGAVSIAASTPSRTRLLKDIEILERMSSLKTTGEEDAHLAMLRASIGRRLKDLVIPIKRYIALAFLLLVAMIVALITAIYKLVPVEIGASQPFVILFTVASPFVGYALGNAASNIAFYFAEKPVKAAHDFVSTVLREEEDRMSENGEDRARGNEPYREDANEGEDVV